MPFTVAVVGAFGRLGTVVRKVVEEAPEAELIAALTSKDGLAAALRADVVVDATVPAVSPEIVAAVVAAGKRVLIGTSGWSEERLAVLRREVAASPGAGAVVIPNFSLGSALATAFATIASRHFDSAEIIEAHHSGKIDSPSGTAVRTAELMAAASSEGGSGPFAAPHADQRARGQQVGGVPIHSLRLAGVVAKQEVLFGGAGEVLSIAHETVSTAAYEAGIRAALLRTAETSGEVVVGLDRVLGLDVALGLSPRAQAPERPGERGNPAEPTS